MKRLLLIKAGIVVALGVGAVLTSPKSARAFNSCLLCAMQCTSNPQAVCNEFCPGSKGATCFPAGGNCAPGYNTIIACGMT